MGIAIAVALGAWAVAAVYAWAKTKLSASEREIERLRADLSAAESSSMFFERILNSIADPVFVKDRQHRFYFLNDAHVALMGYKRDDLLGKTDMDFFPREQVEVFWQKDDEVFRTGKEDINEESLTDAEGRLLTIVTKKALYTDQNGNQYVVGIIRDITERKKGEEEIRKLNAELERRVADRTADLQWTNKSLAEDIEKRRAVEQALMAEKERLLVTLRSIADGVITTDTDRRIQMLNNVAEVLTGWTLEEAVNQPLDKVFALSDGSSKNLGVELLKTVLPLDSEVSEERDVVLVNRLGGLRAVSLSISPIRSRSGGVLGLVLVFRKAADRNRTI